MSVKILPLFVCKQDLQKLKVKPDALSYENSEMACNRCNIKRGNMPINEYLSLLGLAPLEMENVI